MRCRRESKRVFLKLYDKALMNYVSVTKSKKYASKLFLVTDEVKECLFDIIFSLKLFDFLKDSYEKQKEKNKEQEKTEKKIFNLNNILEFKKTRDALKIKPFYSLYEFIRDSHAVYANTKVIAKKLEN